MSSLYVGLLTWLKLEEGDTGPYVDAVGSNDFAESGALTSATGIRGNGILINADEYLTLSGDPGTLDFSGGGWSISIWLNPTDNTDTNNRTLFAAIQDISALVYVGIRHEESDDGSNPNKILFTTNESGVGVAGSGIESHFSSNAFTTLSGSFHHFVATYDDATKAKKLYVDNVLEINATTTHGGPLGPENSAVHSEHRIGINPSLSQYDGVFDEIGFWNRALTALEVNELYAGGVGRHLPFPSFAIGFGGL